MMMMMEIESDKEEGNHAEKFHRPCIDLKFGDAEADENYRIHYAGRRILFAVEGKGLHCRRLFGDFVEFD